MSINIIFSNPYLSKSQFEQLREAERQAGRNSYDSAVNSMPEDAVRISEDARLKAQETSEDMNGKNKDYASSEDGLDQGNAPSRVKSVEMKKMDTNEITGAAKETIDSIRQQIKEVQKKLQQAKEKLQEAQLKLEQAKASALDGDMESPEATAKRLSSQTENNGGNSQTSEAQVDAAGGVSLSSVDTAVQVSIAQTEVQGVSAEIKSLNGQLQALNQELVEAIESVAGGSIRLPGASGGTRAGSGGGAPIIEKGY